MRRRRERPSSGRVVAVTGGAGGLGAALLARLAGRDDLGGLIGIDLAPGRIDGVVWRTADVREPLPADLLTGVDTLVHLATTHDVTRDRDERRGRNVRSTSAVLDAAQRAAVQSVVLVTSADVYGAVAGNPVPLRDDGPLRATPGPDLLGDHLEMERLAADADVPVAVLRPATLVGADLGPEYDGALLRLLAGPRLLAARGTEPQWQLCHTEDLVAALELVVVAGLTGPLPAGCEGAMPQSAVEQLAGKRRVELPAAVAVSTSERLHRRGSSTASPRELDHLLAPVVVGSTGLRAAGWAPRWTNEAALAAHLADRSRSDGRAGAYTAAGATVALLGTAALVRQARRRRRGL